ncbi:helix-turn-helix domain-containing protein [Robbsia sp. KACC 23696]|uniref:GlxA family transcriptional regulator n=1 Tax=Robbsia sp. KACC 23696 TaxID=3149231 RepID=UPI00325AE069
MTTSPPTPRHIAIFVYAGAQPIDIAGPLQTFETANKEAGGEAYRCSVLSQHGGPIRLEGGLTVMTETAADDCVIDTLLIPGGPGVHPARLAPEIVLNIAQLAQRAQRVCSVCTGAYLLAQAGLLDDLDIATHWRSCAALAKEFPRVRVKPDPIWIRQGRIWTSAGVTAGIDLSLAMVESDLGSAVAARTARLLVVYMRRPGGQEQFSMPLAMQAADSFGPLFDWLDANLHRSIKVDDLAEQANMSPRTFARRFNEKLGMTPAKAIEGLRLERAQSLLSTTSLSLSEIARRTGFGRETRLREVFERRLTLGPSQWRARFTATGSGAPS